MTDIKLIVRKSNNLDDWYLIERAEHDGRTWFEMTRYGAKLMSSARISDACVEGTLEEMSEIAVAIRNRGAVEHNRCAVKVNANNVEIWSPRNSENPGRVSISAADDLASQIEALK